MSILTTLYKHYGPLLKDHESDLGIEIHNVTKNLTEHRPYVTISANLTSYGDEAEPIDLPFMDQIYLDTNTSKRVLDIISIFDRNPSGISRRNLHARHGISSIDFDIHAETLAESFDIVEERITLDKLTPKGRTAYETRLFLRRKTQ